MGESIPEEKPKHLNQFERKNQEMIQKLQDKKNQELKMVGEERIKAQRKQDKLKKIIMERAMEHKELKKQQEELKR